uniref:Uncharacterized protein n=1 Tax=Solanum lycopersicum TaxID=4081 RepID=K4DF42_SOLLC
MFKTIHSLPPKDQTLSTPTITKGVTMNNIPQIPSYMAQHPLIFATEPVHPLHQSRSWLETALQNHAAIFSMDINGNHTPKPQLSSTTNNRGNENSNATSCQPHVDDKYARPPCSPPCSRLRANNTNTMESTSPPIPIPKHAQPSANSILHPSGNDQCEPSSLPLAAHASPTRASSVCSYDDTRNVTYELYSSPKNEDKKYIHNFPLALKACSFDLRPALNKDLAKHVVIMAPTVRTSQIPSEEDGEILNPQITHNPMTQQTSFMVWNTVGVNNDNFKRNFKELIHNHNPCFVALLETKMDDHFNLKNEFNFDDYLEVPAQGRAGGMVLMWLTNMVNVALKRMDDQELHATIQTISCSLLEQTITPSTLWLNELLNLILMTLFSKDHRKEGTGGVIRDHKGHSVMGFYHSINAQNHTRAKLEALLDNLKIAAE